MKLFYFVGFLSHILLVSALTCPKCDTTKCPDVSECKGGLVPDVCSCCQVCGKIYGQRCGGVWGIIGSCEKGLICVTIEKPQKIVHFEVGVCVPPLRRDRAAHKKAKRFLKAALKKNKRLSANKFS